MDVSLNPFSILQLAAWPGLGAFGEVVYDVLGALGRHWFILILLCAVPALGAYGKIGAGLGLQNIFHDDRSMFARYEERSGKWAPYLASPAIFSQMGMALLVVLVWGLAHTVGEGDGKPGQSIASLFPEMGWPIVLWLAIGLLCSVRAQRPQASKVPGAAWRNVAGLILGVWLTIFTVWAAAGIEVVADAACAGVLMDANWQLRPLTAFCEERSLLSLSLAAFALAVFLVAVFGERVLPATSLIIILCSVAVIYALISALAEPWRPVALIVLIGYIIWASKVPQDTKAGLTSLRFHYDGLAKDSQSLYLPENRNDLSDEYADLRAALGPAKRSYGEDSADRAEDALETWRKGDWPFEPIKAEKRTDRPADKVDNAGRYVSPIEALENWLVQARAEQGLGPTEKPKLAMVATSGGAYRASFWTAIVLDELLRRDAEDGLPGFGRAIRLITGASGGMVAGAYLAAMTPPPGGRISPILEQLENDILTSQTKGSGSELSFASNFPTPRDSLAPVAQTLALGDFLGLFHRGRRSPDRGHNLERQWLTLQAKFGDLKAGEAAGWRPSILFSPMIVETGQPLLITNLNVDQILAKRRTEVAVLFDWFQEAQENFSLATATRMNAAFPYVSPSTALPTTPVRRVVDAGYYDNYGIDLAVAYLADPDIRDWLLANTSGVALVEIRAFPHAEPWEQDTSPFPPGLQFGTTPIEGMLSARGSTMTFRNMQSFRRLHDTYDLKCGKGGGAKFLRRFTFELKTQHASMNWYLPQHELANMLMDLGAAANTQAIAELQGFWRSIDGEAGPTS